jgi:hypothetical protein
LPLLHGKDEELARVRFRASPKTEEWRGNRVTAVKKQRRWRSVRVLFNHKERRRRVGGRWRTVGFFPFYSGRGGGSGQRAIMAQKRPTVMALMPLKAGVA